MELFHRHLKDEGIFRPGDRLLIAVSGGIDSAVLCELCNEAGYAFTIIHCNFQLRGEESERDEDFVRALGKRYGVEVIVKRFETAAYAAAEKLSIQEAARNLRYSWFAELWRECSGGDTTLSGDMVAGAGARTPVYVLTAHQADDNAETVAMNFFRGTGLHGLTGIPVTGPWAGGYIRRPLLPFSRKQLAAFAGEVGVSFVEDSSNLSSKYTRNFFRNEIFPAIAGVYPEVKHNLQENIRRFSEIEKLYRVALQHITGKLCKTKNGEVHIPVKQLMGYGSRALVYEIISPHGFSEKQVEEVIKLSQSESGRFIQSADGAHRLIRHRHWFIISPVHALTADHIIIEEGVERLQFPGGLLELQVSDGREPLADTNVASLDAKAIGFPLLLRKWKAGDYFYPLGMKKKKKLARFFIDQKMSRTDKERAWVIEMNKKIIWVVGMRIDDRFRLTETTKEVLRIRLS